MPCSSIEMYCAPSTLKALFCLNIGGSRLHRHNVTFVPDYTASHSWTPLFMALTYEAHNSECLLHFLTVCVMSGFRRGAYEICGVLGFYEAYIGSWLATFRDSLMVASSRVKQSSRFRTTHRSHLQGPINLLELPDPSRWDLNLSPNVGNRQVA